MKKILPLLASLCLGSVLSGAAPELVYVDHAGVIRWQADEREVALFGANYCLPSACDYRAAGYVGADRKKLVEKDMAHFARMGWDAVRLCLWGDWENCDVEGNLIVNDHLDVMDYAIAEAKKRGVYILFTPITTYSAWWPDAKPSDPYPGFSAHLEKSALGTDPKAIAAQCNYIRQILEHVNPYTGVALKDEPAILFVEMINEPWHHPEDFDGSVRYIKALADAVRGTGCLKVLFHNLSQDMRMMAAIKASKVQGATFAWYPTGLNGGHALEENHLRSVDSFGPMFQPELLNVPKIVYEFDSPDMNSGYMYPAMARAFRGVGAQFATMFSYDMLDTAPYNLGWQTHFLNLVYSPKKAVSAIIAGEVMRSLPRYVHFGDYPDNRGFGPFRVSYEEDLSEMVTAEKFMYANDTPTNPADVAKLRQIVGSGSSPVVAYEGCGAYFLDRLADGVWRLEVYPDAVIVQDPFAQRLNYQTVSSRLVWHEWPMTVRLPDLGASFTVSPLNTGNHHTVSASAEQFSIRPGVYLLARGPKPDRAGLPARIGQVGLDEFVCPPAPVLPVQVLPVVQAEYAADQPVSVGADVIDTQLPRSVTLWVRPAGGTGFRSVVLVREHGYRYSALLRAGSLPGPAFDYYFVTETADGETSRHPAGADATLTAHLVGPTAPVTLFDADRDGTKLVYTRIGDTGRGGVFKNMPATDTDPAALRLMFPLSLDRGLDDYTASLAIKDRIADRRPHLADAKAISIKARSARPGQGIVVTLLEADGTAWSARLSLAPAWQELRVPLDELQIAQGVLLPLGYPGRWNYWSSPAKGRGAPRDGPHLATVEHVQISFRPSLAGPKSAEPGPDDWADIASITLALE
jgi:hypothetical protein